jgi:hypothetical protein
MTFLFFILFSCTQDRVDCEDKQVHYSSNSNASFAANLIGESEDPRALALRVSFPEAGSLFNGYSLDAYVHNLGERDLPVAIYVSDSMPDSAIALAAASNMDSSPSILEGVGELIYAELVPADDGAGYNQNPYDTGYYGMTQGSSYFNADIDLTRLDEASYVTIITSESPALRVRGNITSNYCYSSRDYQPGEYSETDLQLEQVW